MESKEKNKKKQLVKEKTPFWEEKISLPKTKIKIVGIGGGGNSIVAQIAQKLRKADFLAANTDLRALKKIAKICRVFHFGQELTHNLGTGMDPQLGELAAKRAQEKIEKLFREVDFVVLVSCLGGGTGSGATPIFAQIAKKSGCRVFGIFTLPFQFEGEKKSLIAKESLEKVEPFLDAMMIIANERIFRFVDKKTPLQEALSWINEILIHSLGSLIEIFYSPGLINIDFSDLKTILKGKEKLAYLKSVEAEGPERAEKICQFLFQNQLLEYNIKKPKRVLFNIAAGKDLKISEVEKIATSIYERNPQAKIIFGISQPANFEKKLKVTIFALGSESESWAGERIKRKGPEIGKKEALQKIEEKQKKKRISKEERAETKKILSLKPEEEKKTISQRRNALDLKREIKKAEKEILNQEAKWDFPAFLRRKKPILS